ncbi:TetR/AcrR family transcriptional regulator [Kineosporia mesophila]|uniref:TetR/AcrR family transcriptional regulator n=1 Tax=Kineosporia mesophila TaxID=566012 RepID=A0ABP6ZAW9_9ACTN|nr:TetR/AcrR family transcriptional regulator [Kineosporia mesophila]MCD5354901.1 TetR/AcrR family transcriptional regulator [Kineosporia mesophila]
MSVPPAVSVPRPSEPRDRLLATASRLFYAEGIRSIGVDRLFAEASVTRATFYRHYPGKQDLVVAYITTRDEQYRSLFAQAAGQITDPARLLHTLVVAISETVCGDDFHGCPFINAAAEFPDPESPVHQAVQAHRAWFHATLLDLLTAAGHPDPGRAARTFVMLRDGAMVGGRLDDQQDVIASLTGAVDQLLAAVGH